MKHRLGVTKNDDKVPYGERIPIEHIRQFYNVARKQERSKEDKKFIHELSDRLLYIGERTTVFSRGSAGKRLRYLNDLRHAASTSENIIEIDSLTSFIHGRGRIAPLIIRASRSSIFRLLNSVAKE